ncbi:transporter substrate-binding domain-containing protein [Streptomyces sp. NPDC088923]|uniref:transporter substrate-binding domain-containing protein n=1 Tax=Streptomyces sp. NPDC088923 TaxID=3365913 RepID=UPI003830A76E
MPTSRSRHRRTTSLAALALVPLAATLTACGDDAEPAAAVAGSSPGRVGVGALSNGAAKPVTLKVSTVDALRALLPEEIKDKGELVIGVGVLPAGSPPLNFIGSDQKTVTGSESDLGRLVAATLGLKPVIQKSTWENMFLGVDSGKVDVAFSNVTDTEERKRKYEFASYRQDNLAFETNKSDRWTFTGDYEVLAGRTIAVASGTNQERILLKWQKQLKQEGKKLTVKHYPDLNSTYLALSAKRIDAYLGPNPAIAYHTRTTEGTPRATRSAGTHSGAGAGLQGLIAATAKKDSGLAKPLAGAINHLIDGGQYEKWLAAWNLSDEAVERSEINPPGLPLSDS